MELSEYTRIIAVLPNYFGGGKTVTDAIVEALVPRRFKFTLIAARPYIKNANDGIFESAIGTDIPLAHYSESTTLQLYNLIKPLKGDHLWLIGDEFANVPLLRSALNPGGKVFYHLHSTPFFQVRIKTALSARKRLTEKLFHNYSRRYRRRTGRTAADVDGLITLCRGYADQLKALYPAQANKFLAIYNPISTTNNRPAVEKKREILYLGRLSYADKRVDYLLRIFAKIHDAHPSWKLKIVGDGPERENLQHLAADLGLSRVEFCGFSANPAEHLASASILCMTSDFEGWPMALIEAMTFGTVPIAFNCSAGVAEILADGRGELIPPGDFHLYAERLSQLMAAPDLRNEITARHAPFLEKLSIEKIAAQWEALFK